MKNILLILTLFVGLLVWQSCEYEYLEKPSEPPVNPGDTVSFASDIMPIFERGCNASVCHGESEDPVLAPPEVAYNSLISGGYVDTATPQNSILYTKMAPGGSMNKYTEYGDPDVVLVWIQQGALNN